MHISFRSFLWILTLLTMLFALLSANLPKTVSAKGSNETNLPSAKFSAGDWAQVKSLLPASVANNSYAQQAYLKASNTQANDEFGSAVALSGDTLAIGVPFEDSNAIGVNGDQANNSSIDSGAVYVFTRIAGVWSQQAYLKASNTGAGDRFGAAISLSGDTLIVGASLEDSNATGVNGNQTNNSAIDSGAVYVFTRTGGVWSQQAYLKASNAESGDEFGNAVSFASNTLVVGASAEDSNAKGVNGNQADNSASASGAAYVFSRDGGGVWSQTVYLKASNTETLDQFGYAVSISRNNPLSFGYTLVVGAYGEDSNAKGVNGNQTDNSASLSGAVYVFTTDPGGWVQQAYLKASNTDAFDEFGLEVSLYISTLTDTLVVGAPAESSNATGVNGNQTNNSAANSGAVYIFTRSGSVWSQQAYLKAANTDANDHFGIAISLSNGRLVVGADQEESNAIGVNGNQADNSAATSGAAYVFTLNGGAWSQQTYLKASNTGVGDRFGSTVSLSGNALVIGASSEGSDATGVNGNQTNNLALDSGAGYVYVTTDTLTVKSVGAQDGRILESSEISNQGGALDNTSPFLVVGDDAQDKQYRSFLSFNTSGLPDDAIVTKVKLKVKVQGFIGNNMFTPVKTHGSLLMDIRDPFFGANVNLATADFQSAASKSTVGVLASAPTAGSYTVTLSTTSFPFVNLAGTTQFRLRFQKDDNDDLGADYMKIYSGDAGSTDRPQLIVEYYVP